MPGKKLTVLHVLGCLGMGGAEGRIMDLVRNNKDDNIHYAFLVHSKGPDHYDEEARKLGCEIYRLPRFLVFNYFSYKSAVKKFFKAHPEIDVVQGNMTSTAGIYLPIAKKYGVKLTIAHARSAGVDAGIKGKLTKHFRKHLDRKTDCMWACSSDAAKVVFGEENYNNGLVNVIYDNIDVDSFANDNSKQVISEHGLENKFVVGHVGSFRYAKNHEFLLDVFKEIRKKKDNAVLLLAGEGPLMDDVKSKCEQLGLKDDVIFAGNRKNIADYYHAFNMMIFPSRYEGLPGTVLEAQASGIPVLISDSITRDVDVTELVKYKSLTNSAIEWADEALLLYDEIEKKKKNGTLKDYRQILKDSGFDVHIESEKLNALYHKLADYRPKRILHITGGMYPGGQENFIMNLYRQMDPNECQFDIITHKIRLGDYIPEILERGGRVFLAPRKSKHPIGNYKDIKRIVKFGQYHTVVRHSDNAFAIVDLMAAKSGGAKRRIFQSHSTSTAIPSLHKFFRHFMGIIPTDRFACSQNAGEWMYAKRKFTIVKNAIDVDACKYNADVRLQYRKEFGLEDNKVYMHVGLFCMAKNHKFLIEVFAKILERQPEARLVLVGNGDLKEAAEKQVKELKIDDKVIFAGIRYDVANMLQMADVFTFPSVYEGLPLSVIEAQSAGLKCLLSDRITKEVVVTDLVTQLPLEEDINVWADAAVRLSEDYERKFDRESVANAGYDVKQTASWYAALAD